MLSTKENQTLLSIISAITDAEISKPRTIPVNVYLQEAENLYNWCQSDRELLKANGLSLEIIDDMPACIALLREAQSSWASSRYSFVEAEKLWIEKSPEAREFRNELRRTIKFACRRNQSVQSRIMKMGDGRKNTELIQGLSDLSVMGREHTAELQKVNFDISKLDRAAALASELAALLGAVTTQRAFYSGTYKLRNQAYTHLKEMVDTIREHGQFVFWDNETRLKGYSSEYARKRNQRSKKQKKNRKNESSSEN